MLFEVIDRFIKVRIIFLIYHRYHSRGYHGTTDIFSLSSQMSRLFCINNQLSRNKVIFEFHPLWTKFFFSSFFGT